jgi:hypothetical protein
LILVPTIKSTILLPEAEHVSIRICINMDVFSPAPLHGVIPSKYIVRLFLSMKFRMDRLEIGSKSMLTRSLS